VDLPQLPVFETELLRPQTLLSSLAILHALAAQLAVGGGILAALFEVRGERWGEPLLREFVHRALAPLILIAAVLALVSGVGAWLATSLVAPRASLLLGREFIWLLGAAGCSVAFGVVCGAAYLSRARTAPARRRWLLLGGFILGTGLALLGVEGVLAFRLSPEEWVRTGDAWDGVLGAALAPSLARRVLSSLALAAVAGLIGVERMQGLDESDRRLLARTILVVLVPLALMPMATIGLLGVVTEADGPAPSPWALPLGLAALGSLLVAGGALALLVRGRSRPGRSVVVGLAALVVSSVVIAERARETLALPYDIRGVLYANGLTPEEVDLRRAARPRPREGVAREEIQRGRQVHRELCARCHASRGRSSIQELTRSWDREMLIGNLAKLHRLQPSMPPFAGSDPELEELVAWLLWTRDGGR